MGPIPDSGRENPAVLAVRRARAWFEAQGDPEDFRAFEAFLLRLDDAQAYQEVAEDLGMSAADVRLRVGRVRLRIREELGALLGTAREKPEGGPGGVS